MPHTTTLSDNQIAVIRYLYAHRQSTAHELIRDLRLSAPTITQCLRTLRSRGIVTQGELRQSTGGRKARTYDFNPNHRIAIGIATTPTTAMLRAVNLRGDVVATLDRTLPYRNDGAYWQRLGTLADEFASYIASSHIRTADTTAADATANRDATPSRTSILADMQNTTRDGILGIGLCDHDSPVSPIGHAFHYPYATIHHADASAMAETWFDPTITDAICIYLDRNPSGSLIINGRLHQPSHMGTDGGPASVEHRNARFEHMTLVPSGRECACGQRGCMAAYCSPQTLPEDYESIPGFFSVLEQGETHHRERMGEWMDYVAQAVANIRSAVAADVIIGGEAARYLDDDDIEQLRRRVLARTPADAAPFALRASRGGECQHIIGAALRFVEAYMDDIRGNA